MTVRESNTATVVLIVEDEPLLRELAVEIIEDAGFVALQAANADQAVIRWRPDRISRWFSRTSICPEAWMD
jgi:CheY-like chemotaxis protein